MSSQASIGSAQKGTRRGWRRLGISLAAACLGLLATELCVRWTDWGALTAPAFEGAHMRGVDDPVQLYDNQPGAPFQITFVDKLGAAPRVVKGRVNEDGFRGPRFSREKLAGVTRVACVGDSHTFGYGVADDEPWPAVVARIFERQLGAGLVEVINAGVDAYDAEQEALWLERSVLDWQPDVVVWQYFLNDVAMRGMPLKKSQMPGLWLRLTQPKRKGVVGFLRRHSRAVDLVAEQTYQRLALDMYGTARDELYGADEPAWHRVQAALLRAKELCQARGARMVVVLLPYLHRLGSDPTLPLVGRRAHRIVGEFCRANGLQVLDLEELFAGMELAPLRLHPREYHANAQAYALIGRRVADWLLETGAVPVWPR